MLERIKVLVCVWSLYFNLSTRACSFVPRYGLLALRLHLMSFFYAFTTIKMYVVMQITSLLVLKLSLILSVLLGIKQSGKVGDILFFF